MKELVSYCYSPSENIHSLVNIICALLIGDEESILPTWTAIDPGSVLTSRELWDKLKSEGWSVEVGDASWSKAN